MGVFAFGESVEGYPVRVLNEREVRAGAGVLFLFAMIVFMNAWLIGDFSPIRLFVVAFFVDFVIRVLINPRYSPSLIIGRFFVRSQEVEYVGAPQKRFAWAIGLALASFMLVWLVVLGMLGPINLMICLLCLTFLFFESAFGICVGCKIYPLVTGKDPVLCAGGVCTVRTRAPIQRISVLQALVVVAFIALIAGIGASTLDAAAEEEVAELSAPAPQVVRWSVPIAQGSESQRAGFDVSS